ncbi:MAG TPA: LLM class flavin-dependent oxidoreductase [Candidatus Acidoferrales bacterium]|nr:LLM class flavin-dependent oxidoreductase [Candidatus Acidoferrales bacterium]
MQFDIGILPQEPVAGFMDLIVAAEELGFGGVWIADSQSIFRDVYVALAVCALRTKRMTLATGVTNPVTRHPATIACSIATLDELSGGRAILGLGSGFSSVQTLGLKPAPLKQMEETTRVLRALMGGQTAIYDGKEIKMTWTARQVPIYFASSGPKSLELAGRVADGVLFQVGSVPALVRYAIESVRRGAIQAGRDPREIKLCARLGCAVSEDREAAREEIRAYAAAAAETVFQSNRQGFLAPDLVEDLRKLKEHYNYYEHANLGASHKTLVTDRLLDAMVIAGTPKEVIGRFEEILDLGVDRIVIPLTVKDRRKFLEDFAQRVIRYLH